MSVDLKFRIFKFLRSPNRYRGEESHVPGFFSHFFPLRYFEVYWLEPDWPTFLDDFQKHWPTDED